jgi:ribose transport system ATP-binding protein
VVRKVTPVANSGRGPEGPLPSGDARALLRVAGVSKSFPGTKALTDFSLEVGAGEIVAVVGQNGSGKSTLVKVLAGVYEMDSGTVEVLGTDGSMLGGRAASAALHFIHQDLGLVAGLTAVENLALGRRLTARSIAPRNGGAERRLAEEQIRRFGGDFDVTVPISKLSPPERTIVAIVRALADWGDSNNLLVLDEPTAALQGEEVEVLFRAVRRVAAEGAGVLFISHRLDEVLGLADRVVALRDGLLVADEPIAKVDQAALIRMIVGREMVDRSFAVEGGEGAPLLEVKGLSGGRVGNADLTLRAGEIVGVTGLIGSGREHLSPLIFGGLPRTGEVRLEGRVMPDGNPRESIDAGLAYVPADRRADGAVMTLTMRENLTLPQLKSLRRGLGWLSSRAELDDVGEWIERTEIRPPDPSRPLEKFSGGNQQKVVIAKSLRTEPRVLLLDEPTQGVDVGAKAAIYELVAGAARDGCAVMVCSSDAKELAALCGRVLVMRDGEIVAQLASDAISESRMVEESTGMETGATEAPQKERIER